MVLSSGLIKCLACWLLLGHEGVEKQTETIIQLVLIEGLL